MAANLPRSRAYRRNPPPFKHVAIAWAMHSEMPLNDAAQYFSTSCETLERVSWHHHPDLQNETAATVGATWIDAAGK